MTEQEFDPQEFASAEEALDCIFAAGLVKGLLGNGQPDEVGQAAFDRSRRACVWVRKAVEYAQARGWPDRPMMARSDVLEAYVLARRVPGNADVALANTLQGETHLQLLHELALLMNAERSAKEGDDGQ